MNYSHTYHAGNFADVFKHIVLTRMLQLLQRKATPLCYIDGHAGEGKYLLKQPAPHETAEFQEGIAKLWGTTAIPAAVQPYMELIQRCNRSRDQLKPLKHYPGSPWIAQQLLRDSDRMIAVECQRTIAHTLQKQLGHDRRLQIYLEDTATVLRAALPPRERRGLILLDAPFERRDEWRQQWQILNECYKRWASGVIALWYPIKHPSDVSPHKKRWQSFPDRLIVEFFILPSDVRQRLNGCGMLILNPPWRLKEELQQIMPWLWQTLTQDAKRTAWSVE